MNQSKKISLIESIINTIIGLLVTLIFSPLIYWICGVEITYTKMTIITVLFTLISIGRNYIVRRIFNKMKWMKLKE